MGEYVDCVECGRPFWASHDWKRRCYHCYMTYNRTRQRRERTSYRPPRPAPSIHIVTEPDADGDWLRANIKQLIQLCHPDLHGGSELSNKITAKLLEIRKKKH